MTEILEEFYDEHLDKIKLVISGIAQSSFKEFYTLIYSKRWLQDRKLEQQLLQYLKQNIKAINKSLSLLGIKHNQIKHQAEMKLKKSKPFLTTVTRVTYKTELSD